MQLTSSAFGIGIERSSETKFFSIDSVILAGKADI
jgi:hypothetical protein